MYEMKAIYKDGSIKIEDGFLTHNEVMGFARRQYNLNKDNIMYLSILEVNNVCVDDRPDDIKQTTFRSGNPNDRGSFRLKQLSHGGGQS